MESKRSFWVRLKGLHMWGRKYFRILVIAEALLLLLATGNLFGRDAVYQYEAQENSLEFQNISLPAGTYRVRMQYVTDTDVKNNCFVRDSSISQKNLRTNGTMLFAGLNQTDFEMWLLQDTAQLAVYAQYGGEGMLEVQGLTICETNALGRIVLFLAVCLVTAVNICCVYREYDRTYQIPVQSKNVTFCLGLVTLFASLPLMIDGMPGAGDLVYHLMRVEGIKDGLLTGQFPIRISPQWLQGYGYASPVFYGETILYIAALFRLIGFSLTASYRLFMFVIVAATVLVSYICFKKVFRDAWVGVFCSMLYSVSVYRIFKTYLCGSWGETFGILILPVLVYGFYRVFSQDVSEKSYGRSWIPLTIGFSLLVQSHLLTGELVGFFTIILCLVFIKRVLRKKTFLVLAKTVLYSVLISAWFLVPFADYMTTGDFVIHHVSERTIQDRGMYPAHLLFTFFRGGSNVFFTNSGMADTQPMGVGISLIAALLIFGFMMFNRKREGMKKEELTLGKISGWFAAASMFMSLSLFPWNKIQSLGGIAATLVSSIQFPNRLLTIANVCLVTVAGVVAKYVFTGKKQILKYCYAGGMVFLLSISSIFLMNDMINTIGVFRGYNSESIGTGNIAGAEYLPYGANASALMYHDPVGTEGVTVQDYERKPLGARAYVRNEGTETGAVSFSLLYYKGYRAMREDTQKALECYAGNNMEVTVAVPEGFEGTVTVGFQSPWYWRLGEIVSVFTLLVMIISSLWVRKREREGQKHA